MFIKLGKMMHKQRLYFGNKGNPRYFRANKMMSFKALMIYSTTMSKKCKFYLP